MPSTSRDFDATTEAVPQMLAFVAEASAPLPAQAAFDVALVSEEVLTNIASYAYPHRNGVAPWVRVSWSHDAAAREAVISFEDTGVPFDPLSAPLPDLAVPWSDRPLGGLGLVVIRLRTDDAHYARDGDRNVLTLTKRY